MAAEVLITTESVAEWPEILRPSVMLSFADAASVGKFVGLPGKLGCIRLSLSGYIAAASSQAEYEALLRGADYGLLRQVIARGAKIFAGIEKMPKWLTSSGDTTVIPASGWEVRETMPASSLPAFGEFVAATVRILGAEQGLPLHFEFWNEPNAGGVFWGGTEAEFRAHYEQAVGSAKAVQPGVIFGGPAVVGVDSIKEGPLPFLAQFLAGLTPGTPLDFVTWHLFAAEPRESWLAHASLVRGWLEAVGRDPLTPQYVTEFNQQQTLGSTEPLYDGPAGAAYYVTAAHEMRRAGIAGHTWAAMQDFRPGAAPSLYIGGQGLLLREPGGCPKASFNALQLLAKMDGGTEVWSAVNGAADAQGIGATAAVVGSTLLVLVHRFPRVTPFGPVPLKIHALAATGAQGQVIRIRSDQHNPMGAYQGLLQGGASVQEALAAAAQAGVLVASPVALAQSQATFTLEPAEVLLLALPLQPPQPPAAVSLWQQIVALLLGRR